jgi:hypothetical protein
LVCVDDAPRSDVVIQAKNKPGASVKSLQLLEKTIQALRREFVEFNREVLMYSLRMNEYRLKATVKELAKFRAIAKLKQVSAV